MIGAVRKWSLASCIAAAVLIFLVQADPQFQVSSHARLHSDDKVHMLQDLTDPDRIFVSDHGQNAILALSISNPDSDPKYFAGDGSAGWMDGERTHAQFNNPRGICQNSRGDLFVVDSGNAVIRKIDMATGQVSTIAGQPHQAGEKDGRGDVARFSLGISAIICDPWVAAAEQLHVLDSTSNSLRFVKKIQGPSTLTNASMYMVNTTHYLHEDTATHMTANPKQKGHVLFSDLKTSVIYSLDVSTPESKPEAFSGLPGGGYKDGSREDQALYLRPRGICFDEADNGYIVDSGNLVVRRVDAVNDQVYTIAGRHGQQGHVDGEGSAAKFSGGMVDIICLRSSASASIRLILSDGGNSMLRLIECVQDCNGQHGDDNDGAHPRVWWWLLLLMISMVLVTAASRAVCTGMGEELQRRIRALREKHRGAAGSSVVVEECEDPTENTDVSPHMVHMRLGYEPIPASPLAFLPASVQDAELLGDSGEGSQSPQTQACADLLGLEEQSNSGADLLDLHG